MNSFINNLHDLCLYFNKISRNCVRFVSTIKVQNINVFDILQKEAWNLVTQVGIIIWKSNWNSTNPVGKLPS